MRTLPLQVDLTLARYQQVTALSDSDITLRIAKLEQVDVREHPGFNPLENGDIALALMDKYGISRSYEPYDFIGWSCWQEGGANPCHITEHQDWSPRTNGDFSLKKCICLAVLLNSDPDFTLPKKLKLPENHNRLTLDMIVAQFCDQTSWPLPAISLLERFAHENTAYATALLAQCVKTSGASATSLPSCLTLLKCQHDIGQHYAILQQGILDSDTQVDLAHFLLRQPELC